jgi:hypothetical protein
VPGARESVLAGGHLHLVWPSRGATARTRRDRGALPPASSLQTAGKNEAEALGQVARGAADRKLMEQLLRIYGYYDPR